MKVHFNWLFLNSLVSPTFAMNRDEKFKILFEIYGIEVTGEGEPDIVVNEEKFLVLMLEHPECIHSIVK